MKSSGKQNYLCKNCFRQFIGDHAPTYKGCHSELIKRILLMLVRGIGIRDTRIQCPKGIIRTGKFSLCNYSP